MVTKTPDDKKKPKFYCKKCDFLSCNRKDYKRHLKTQKHLKQIEQIQHFCKFCNKEYKFRSGLSRHIKKCEKYKIHKKGRNGNILGRNGNYPKMLPSKNVKMDEKRGNLCKKRGNLQKSHEKNNNVHEKNNNIHEKKDICHGIFSKSHENKKTQKMNDFSNNEKNIQGNYLNLPENYLNNIDLLQLIYNQQKQTTNALELLKEAQKTNAQLIPRIGNNNNNKISINVFLNENCKNAINLKDFVENVKISLEDIMYTKDNGCIKGITNIFNKQLKDMDPIERPIHCSDVKRLQFYVKDDDKWEKESADIKLNESIQEMKLRQMRKLSEWEKLNPGYMKDDQLLHKWQHMIHQIIGDPTLSEEKLNNSIKKELAPNIYVKDAINNNLDNK